MDFRMFLIKSPSAWLPIVMSTAACALVIGHITLFGVTQQQDEGTAARIFQSLMAGQIPIIAFFAIKWLPKKQTQALQVLAVQFIAGFLAFATVFFLEL